MTAQPDKALPRDVQCLSERPERQVSGVLRLPRPATRVTCTIQGRLDELTVDVTTHTTVDELTDYLREQGVIESGSASEAWHVVHIRRGRCLDPASRLGLSDIRHGDWLHWRRRLSLSDIQALGTPASLPPGTAGSQQLRGDSS